MAGICAARRRRRLAPLPSSLRPVALILCSVAMCLLTLLDVTAHPRPGGRRMSVHVQRTDGFTEGDAADGFREQLGDAELADAAAGLGGFAERNGVGHHQLVELRFGQVVDRSA